jgi:hypothetical protein
VFDFFGRCPCGKLNRNSEAARAFPEIAGMYFGQVTYPDGEPHWMAVRLHQNAYDCWSASLSVHPISRLIFVCGAVSILIARNFSALMRST